MLVLFFIMAVLTILASLGVVINKNPVYSALCLVVTLLTVAGFFAMLDAHFLAAVQIIVYAGAIMVLFLFVIMLLNLKTEQPMRLSVLYNALAWLSGAGLVMALIWVFLPMLSSDFTERLTTNIGASAVVEGTVKQLGALVYTKYLLPFEASSVLLIAAIVGAIMLAKRKTGYKELEPTKPVGR